MSNVCDLVIFGGTGDLSLRKLIPALYRANVANQLSQGSKIFLVSRDQRSDEDNLEFVDQALQNHLSPGEYETTLWESFKHHLGFACIDFLELDERWDALKDALEATGNGSRVYYYATPPSIFGKTSANLAAKELITPDTRVVLEKPIGYDHESANEINAQVASYFKEDQIYRIDHYLGKETVQNLMALRFGNVIFEPLWDSKIIDHVEVTIAESVGLEGRTGYYDKSGALRDMVQNHLLQMLCLLTMEPPQKLDAENIRAEKLKVLKGLRRIDEKNIKTDTIRGQYVGGVIGGKAVRSYQDELNQDSKGSTTETYVAIKAHIDNWRWAGVPFYLRTGKRMGERFAEIIIHYKPVSHRVFDKLAGPLEPNRLTIRLQPEENMQLTLMSKELNRQGIYMRPANLNLNFADTFKYSKSDAYQRLVIDAVKGNPALFTHRDEVDQAWAWVDPIIDAWESENVLPEDYPSGSWGPVSAETWFQKG